MPKVFDWNGCRFHFYANEGDPREPMHIHIARPGAEAKFWLYPEVELAYNRGFDARTIRRLHDVVLDRRGEIEGAWMTFSPSPTGIRFDDDQMWVELDDGRTLGIPLVWFPRLLRATPEQRGRFFMSPGGLHWEELDEDISVGGLLAGRGDTTRVAKSMA